MDDKKKKPMSKSDAVQNFLGAFDIKEIENEFHKMEDEMADHESSRKQSQEAHQRKDTLAADKKEVKEATKNILDRIFSEENLELASQVFFALGFGALAIAFFSEALIISQIALASLSLGVMLMMFSGVRTILRRKKVGYYERRGEFLGALKTEGAKA